jgi:quercetin dioxygenase-like cupin family protein
VAVAAGISEQFAEAGYLGPVQVLSKGDCRRFLRAVDLRPEAPLDWGKGMAATSRAYYEIATRVEILDVASELLGDEVILWGASIQRRAPDEVHPWHSDIECSDPGGRAVSVWIGLEHTTPESSLLVLSRSHRFGATVQQVRQEKGKGRDEIGTEELAGWARERDGRSELVRLGVTNGEALFFDGRLWHGTHNVSRRTRLALLLQYAAPDTAIRIPDLNYLDWPFRMLDSPRPPCLIVRGSAREGFNRVVPAPVAGGRIAGGLRLTSRIHPLRLPLEPDGQAWKPYPAFRGSTADLPSLSCHASVLVHGHSPHPPHRHAEEELLLLLAGEVELDFAENGQARLRPGGLAYYPANFAHTLKATSAEPAMYVMFKWRGEPAVADQQLPSGLFETAGGSRILFEGSTQYLRKLHSHVTVLEPGGGYEPHVDAYDVAIVVLEGALETIGGHAAPHDVIFYRAGEAHGMRNVGDGPARYVVFEFHGRTSLASGAPTAFRALLEKLSDPRRWKGKLRQVAQALRRNR